MSMLSKSAIAALFGAIALCFSGAPADIAAAQEQTVPQGQDAPGAENGSGALPDARPGESLSERLDREQGVIEPPPTGDTGIYTEAPNPNPGTTPVIPPPGTPGGDPQVQPK